MYIDSWVYGNRICWFWVLPQYTHSLPQAMHISMMRGQVFVPPRVGLVNTPNSITSSSTPDIKSRNHSLMLV